MNHTVVAIDIRILFIKIFSEKYSSSEYEIKKNIYVIILKSNVIGLTEKC